jgi:hypothetical protein
MTLHKFISSAWVAAKHPAVLFSAGNVALIIGQAEPLAILLNIGLTLIIFSARFIEAFHSRTFGIPFSILASVNFLTAFSIEFNQALGIEGSRLFAEGLRSVDMHAISNALFSLNLHNLIGTNQTVLAAHASASALIIWGFGSLFAARQEKKNVRAHRVKENPQAYYGAGDMIAVNAAGTLNLYSFPFMVFGFIKSMFIGRASKKKRNTVLYFAQGELTAARIYGIGYLIGALTSLVFLNFAIAQLLWALGYFGFKKDT